jgi:hypothetical protein
MTARWVVTVAVLGIVAATARRASAESWYFDWHCQSTSQGDCGSTGASGTEGPFASDGDCESAQTQVALRINGPGNAGSTSGCRQGDGGTSSSARARPPARAARLDRWMIGVVAGRGYDAHYANGTTSRSAAQIGGQLEAVFGRPQFGLSVFGGAERDDGTSPDPATPASAMWLVDFGIGLVASPFAIVRTPTFELRPELGIYGIDLERTGCDRCTTDGPLGTTMPAESSSGLGWRLRVGLDAYWGDRRERGLALDGLIQFVALGDAADPLSSAVLTPPKVMLRLSYLSRQVD